MVILPGMMAEAERAERRKSRVVRGLFLAAGLTALFLQAEMGKVLWNTSEHIRSGAALPVSALVRSKLPDFLKNIEGRHGVLFAIDPADFGCPPCFESFQALSEEMSHLLGKAAARRGVFLIREASEGPWSDSSFARRWADAQGFPFPILMVPESSYALLDFRKTSLVLIDTSFEAVLVEGIPVRKQTHATIRSLVGD